MVFNILSTLQCVFTKLIIALLHRYHVPRSWFQPSGNTLVIFEEKGGDPSKIKFARRRATSICGSVAEAYPSDLGSMVNANEKIDAKNNLYLACSRGSFISSIKFASFGTPTGSCGSYSQGICHYANSIPVMKEVYLFVSHLIKILIPLGKIWDSF